MQGRWRPWAVVGLASPLEKKWEMTEFTQESANQLYLTRENKVWSHTGQVGEDEGPQFGSKDLVVEGMNTKDQGSAAWPGSGGLEAELWMLMGFLAGTPAVWWTAEQKSNFSPVRTRNSVRRESDKGEILCCLLGQLLLLTPSHCNMIPKHQGHLNQHKVTETSAHKKPAHSQISTSTQVWRII